MRGRFATLAVAGLAIMALAGGPMTVRAADATRTLVIGDRGRDGERAAGLVSNDGPSWGIRSDEFCGEVGNPPGESFRLGTELVFPLRDLPDGARVTRATLAIHDSNPAAAPTIKVIGFIGEEMLLGVEPLHPTGSVTIAPAAGDGREAFDVSGLVTGDTVALGWAGFWLEPGDGAEGIHDISCPREALYPTLTLDYVIAASSPAPGTLTIGTGRGVAAIPLRRLADGSWVGLTSWLCGEVGRRAGEGIEGRVALLFPLRGLPSGARVTGATLAVHEDDPGSAGAIALVGFIPGELAMDDLMRDNGEPEHPTGSVTIRPVSAETRESWDVTELVTDGVVANGRAGSLLRPADDSDGMHHIACPGDPFYPILTVEYVAPAAPEPTAEPVPTLPPTTTAPPRGGASEPPPAFVIGAGALGATLGLLLASHRRADHR